ncbi:endonuclease VII domain-containing protein [Amycolatopsis orientalis]|uniref:endonuclease VII domain-containing protein n=1 Tax=Amycolatopsis orientalis TaxID=31958 RepID=UPI0009DBE859
MAKGCKDCAAEGSPLTRPADYPGPRCYTHHKAVKKARRERAQAQRIERVYSITEDQYQELYRAQGGACAICQRATGKTKRLAVDHDHSCCPGPVSCGKCVRGLLCTPCNKGVLGHLRDSPDALRRAAEYIDNPPARRVFS